MPSGSSQGSAYPGHSSRHTSWFSPKHPLSCEDETSSWACRGRETPADEICQSRSEPSRAGSRAVPSVAQRRRHSHRRPRGVHLQRAAFAAGEITLEYACARSARSEVRVARRQWTEQVGQASPQLAMWTSRDGWISELSGWLASDSGLAECRRLHVRPERVLRVAMVLAAHADHGTGRHCAVTNATVARGAGCSERTVTTVRKVLGASGLAVMVAQGHGSPTSARIGWRPAVWHLISRREPVDKPARGGAVCDLPSSRRDGRLSHLKNQSPSARTRASKVKSDPSNKPGPRRRRCAPRPLAIQRLADELVGNSYGRAPLLHGLRNGHIGAICDALIASGIDPQVWSATQIRDALNEDMRARNGSWPDQIEQPAAFLASRLRRLAVRPAGAPRGGRAAGLDNKRAAAAQESAATTAVAADALVQRWYAEVRAITTPQQRELLLHAHSVKFENSRPAADPVAALANAGRRAARLFPDISGVDGLMRWASEVLGQRCGSDLADAVSAPRSLADDLLMEMAIAPCACVQCGAADAVERPELPLKSMSMVCEQCWPAIAADLALTSQLGQK